MSPRSLDPDWLATLPLLERQALTAVTAFLWGNGGDVAKAAEALTALAAEDPAGRAREMDDASVLGLDVASMPADMQERYRELLRVMGQS
jgi:hypothetical protein